MLLEESMIRQLEEREKQGTLRTLRVNETEVDFYSNDYLSLSDYETVLADQASPGSSRLIAGNTPLHEKLEVEFAKFVGGDSALLFNNGYTANIGVLSSIPQKNDIILFDELSHASIKDGIRLSLAKGIRYKHNDTDDLQRKLENYKGQRCFVVTEGLFSMNGVFGKITSIDQLCTDYNAYLIVDEAHSGGTVDKEGKGICASLDIKPFLTIYTLGKAFGSHGACVVCSSICRNFLINFSRPFIYTTALPISVIQRSLEILKENIVSERVVLLHGVVEKFNSVFNDYVFSSEHTSPIKIYSPSPENISKLRKIEDACLAKKVGVKVIYPPTVPKGKSCIRISLHAKQTETEIETLHSIFNQVLS